MGVPEGRGHRADQLLQQGVLFVAAVPAGEHQILGPAWAAGEKHVIATNEVRGLEYRIAAWDDDRRIGQSNEAFANRLPLILGVLAWPIFTVVGFCKT